MSFPGDPARPAVPPSTPELSAALPAERPGAVWPAATTQITGVVGYPARYSLSPRLQNAAFSKMGLDWCYLAFEVAPESFASAVLGAGALGVRGLSVTMPHKDAAARLATRHSRQVRRLGAANTLVFEPGVIRAESCDGDGLLDDLRTALGFDPDGRRCGVIGAGGAGRATVLALAEAGAAEVIVVNRTAAKAWRSVALAPRVAHVGRPEELKGADLVVQATPAGMARLPSAPESRPRPNRLPSSIGSEQLRKSIGYSLSDLLVKPTGPSSPLPTHRSTRSESPPGPAPIPAPSGYQPFGSLSPELPIPMAGQFVSESTEPQGSATADPSGTDAGLASVAGVNPSWFGHGQLVVDLVYEPPVTPFLFAAECAGATVRSGLGMLVHQAGRQIRLWTGMEPPLAAMWDAVQDHTRS